MPRADHFAVWDGNAPIVSVGESSLTFGVWDRNAPVLIIDVQEAAQSVPHTYGDGIMLALFKQESVYGTWLSVWNATTACAMRDFDRASTQDLWDDVLEDDDAVLHNTEYPLRQEIVRQSVRFSYTEPRVKPNTLAGLLGLALGSLTTTQDGSVTAYRHKIVPASPLALPSINAQVAHTAASQYLYTGMKSDGFTLRNNGAYLAFTCPLLGSGSREDVITEFVPAIDEAWLRWGDSRLYIADMTGVVLSIPTTPGQTGSNLGSAAVDISTRALSMEVNHPNALWAEGGYRPSTGVLRGRLLTAQRRTDVSLTLQVDTAREATELAWYLQQSPLAFEWQCASSTLIAIGGTFYWGATILIPKLQLRRVQRGEDHAIGTIEFAGRILDDQTNPVMVGFVYNAQPTYLAA